MKRISDTSIKIETEQLQVGCKKILTEAAVEIEVDKQESEQEILNKDEEGEGKRNTDDKEKESLNKKDDKINTFEEMILECLLKHYKCLCLLGIKFTWLGVHKIYRVILVACRTFITEPVTRLYVMTGLVAMMTALNAFIKPYKEQTANTTATLSYMANLLIAIINIGKAQLVNYGCDTSF